MKILTKIPSKDLEDIIFELTLNSKSGVNIKVGDEFYKVWVENTGTYNIEKFIPEFELTKEEFKKYFR